MLVHVRRAAVLAMIAGVGACLESLPEPIVCDPPSKIIDAECVTCAEPLVFVGDECVECPPAAQVANTSCLETVNTIIEAGGDGCVGDFDGGFDCVAGTPPDCACDAEDCTEDLVCYGDGGCPPEVLASAPDAVCLPVTEERWSWYAAPFVGADTRSESCICGCMRCATTCDGKGTIFGVYEDGDAPNRRQLQGPKLDLRGLLPSSGKLGLYVRGRGWASIAALVTRDPMLANNDTAYFLVLLNDFSAAIAFSPADEGGEVDPAYPRPYSWSSEDEAPGDVMFLMTFVDDEFTGGIVEIDCVIPFVVPE